MEFEIHIECQECDGYGILEHTDHGVNANGPWVDYIEKKCPECSGSGLKCIGTETHESYADVKADYPFSYVRNMETGVLS